MCGEEDLYLCKEWRDMLVMLIYSVGHASLRQDLSYQFNVLYCVIFILIFRQC